MHCCISSHHTWSSNCKKHYMLVTNQHDDANIPQSLHKNTHLKQVNKQECRIYFLLCCWVVPCWRGKKTCWVSWVLHEKKKALVIVQSFGLLLSLCFPETLYVQMRSNLKLQLQARPSFGFFLHTVFWYYLMAITKRSSFVDWEFCVVLLDFRGNTLNREEWDFGG